MTRCSPGRAQAALRRHLRDERAAMSIEAAIILPLLIFLYAAGYSWFDAYRRETAIFRASYAVADALSRRTDLVSPEELDGFQGLFEELVGSAPDGAYMRFSEVRRGSGGLEVVWSYATDDQPALTPDRVGRILRRVPTLAEGERVTVIETFTADRPIFNVGLSDRVISNVIPTRQRYDPRLAFAPGEGRRGDPSVIPNDTDCGDDIVPVGGQNLVGPGNCA